MEIRQLLAGPPVEIETVVYADRTERRHPPDAGAGRLPQVGQVELGAEAIDVADVEEPGEPDVERQRNDVLDIPEDLGRAADAGAELVDRRDLSRLEAADGVGPSQIETLEDRQVLIAEAEAVARLHASRQDVSKPDRLEAGRQRGGLHVVVIAAETGGVRPEHQLAALAGRLDAVAAVPREGARDQRGHLCALLLPQERILGKPDVVDAVLREAIARLPAPILFKRMAEPQPSSDRAVVVLDELPLCAEEIEAGCQRAIEQPGLCEADLPLLDFGTGANPDRGDPAAAEEVVLREIDRTEEAVRGGEAAAEGEETRRPLGDVDVHNDLALVRAGRGIDVDLLEIAEVRQTLLASLQLAQREDLALGHLQLATQDLVLAAHVARDVDALDVDRGSLVDLEGDGDLVVRLRLHLGIHVSGGSTDVRIEVLERLDGVPKIRAREHVAGLELDLPAQLALRHQRDAGETNRRHVEL